MNITDSYPHFYAQNGQVVLRTRVNEMFYLSGNHLRNIFTREEWDDVIMKNLRIAKERLISIRDSVQKRNESWRGTETITL